MEQLLTATSLMRASRYYEHFILARTKALSVIFFYRPYLSREYKGEGSFDVA